MRAEDDDARGEQEAVRLRCVHVSLDEPGRGRLTCEVLNEHQRNLLAERPDGVANVGVELLPFPPLLALFDCIRRIIQLHSELCYCLLCDAPMPCEAGAQPWSIAAVCDEQSLQKLPR